MSRHRQKFVDYDDYDDECDDYDGYTKPVIPPKSKSKKNKKKTAPETEPANPVALSIPPTHVNRVSSCGNSSSIVKSLVPANDIMASVGTKPMDATPPVSHLFSGLSDDDGEAERKSLYDSGVGIEAKNDSAPILPCLTVIIAGHVDAGKSTLVGNLLFQTGKVSSRIIEMHQREAERSGKSSFHFAWVTDESASEREHGVTISAATKFIQTEHRQIALLDAPGHKDYVPNMIASAALADAALLVVPATMGEFETAIGSSSQTREHAVLLKAMGCNNVVVVVNKMDKTEPAWSEARYNSICRQLRDLLESLQFPHSSIQCVPVSGLTGANVVSGAVDTKIAKSAMLSTVSMTDVCPWYVGPALLEALDCLPVMCTATCVSTSTSLRAVVSSVSDSSKGCDVTVKILRGRLMVGQTVGFLGGPDGVATAKFMRAGDESRPLTQLSEGEQGQVLLCDRMNNNTENMGITTGTILFKGPPLLRPVALFKAAIITMPDILPPIISGSEFELFLLGREFVCSVKKIYGQAKGKMPVKCIVGGRSAVVQITTAEPIMIEEFHKCRALGRFVLRSHGKTFAVGIVDKLYP